jgi:hypothetical protein
MPGYFWGTNDRGIVYCSQMLLQRIEFFLSRVLSIAARAEALGGLDLFLRDLLGDGAPLSVSSIFRLKAKWQLEYEEWKTQDLSALLRTAGRCFLHSKSGYRESNPDYS